MPGPDGFRAHFGDEQAALAAGRRRARLEASALRHVCARACGPHAYAALCRLVIERIGRADAPSFALFHEVHPGFRPRLGVDRLGAAALPTLGDLMDRPTTT